MASDIIVPAIPPGFDLDRVLIGSMAAFGVELGLALATFTLCIRKAVAHRHAEPGSLAEHTRTRVRILIATAAVCAVIAASNIYSMSRILQRQQPHHEVTWIIWMLAMPIQQCLLPLVQDLLTEASR